MSAARNPRTAKPGTKRLASLSRKALTTRRNSPRVSRVSGKVNNFKTKPMVELTRAMITVANSAVPKLLTEMPGITWATIQRASALSSQLTIRCISMEEARPLIMVSHGADFCRYFRLRVSAVEAAVLSRRCARQEVPELLRAAAELCGDQLHLPAHAGRGHAGELGGSDAAGLRVCAQGASAHHAHSAFEECGRGYGPVSARHRSARICGGNWNSSGPSRRAERSGSMARRNRSVAPSAFFKRRMCVMR